MTGFDMHFRYAKIMVATSVCTGDRHCPPDSAIEMGSNPANKTDLAKDYHKGNPWLNGPDDRIRTCGILLPKQALYQTEPHPDASPVLYMIAFEKATQKYPRFPTSFTCP